MWLFFAPRLSSSAIVDGNGLIRWTGPFAMSTVVCPRTTHGQRVRALLDEVQDQLVVAARRRVVYARCSRCDRAR